MVDLEEKYRRLSADLKGMARVAVAYSGGVDSTLLLRLAHDLLGDDVVALTVDTPLVTRAELADSRRLAEELGVRQLVLSRDILALPAVAQNPPDRCYHCKAALFTQLLETARGQGIEWLVDGSNLDDLDDYRPGKRALAELGIASPLQEAGFTKADIRELSRQLGLSTWDRPAAACLASRIPSGTPLTRENLAQVERCEAFLHGLGYPGCRVRNHGQLARIEVAEAHMERLVEPTVRHEVVGFFREAGFRYVTLDLEGYRMGSLNPEG